MRMELDDSKPRVADLVSATLAAALFFLALSLVSG